MLIDASMVKSYIKPKSASTLQCMRKAELITYIRTLEHNYNVAVSFNQQQAENIESMIKSGAIPPTWIPVEERLPTPGKRVLMCLEYGFVAEGYLMQGGKWGRYDELACVEDLFHQRVSYWMPMPEPKREEVGK